MIWVYASNKRLRRTPGLDLLMLFFGFILLSRFLVAFTPVPEVEEAEDTEVASLVLPLEAVGVEAGVVAVELGIGLE